MSTLAVLPLKRSATRRFLRSYFGRIVVALILIAGISRGIWWKTFAEFQKENRIAEKIWHAGGGVGREGILVNRRIDSVNLSKCTIPNGLAEDINKLRHLELLDLGNTLVNDADLEQLRGLDLAYTQISDAGVEHLKGMNISRLDLRGTAVTEAGFEHLKELPNLTDLTFVDTHLSDVGLEHLKGMTKLKRLILYSNSSHRAKLITPKIRAELEAALPNCQIIP